MMAMPEETIKEIAATSEQSPGSMPPRGLVSQEFFFLLQRIDRLDEKLSARMDKMDDKLNNIRLWAISTVVAILVGFIGVIATLINH
ncbi:hypothetical protein [Desulfofundulus thermobenzoicus]|nr:hypothetical protein [Desulfofundulus thermobenzoicus]